jgi:CheY-like chemotaxis protein
MESGLQIASLSARHDAPTSYGSATGGSAVALDRAPIGQSQRAIWLAALVWSSAMAQPPQPLVYVVDDDLGIRESLRFLFEDAGYVVEEAEDGGSALAALHADARPSIVLLDRMMPRMSGLEALHAIAEQPAILERVVILFMTARNDPPQPELAEVLQRHAITTIIKPFDLDTLLAEVARASRRLVERPMAQCESGSKPGRQ